jgi:hypothetical protein
MRQFLGIVLGVLLSVVLVPSIAHAAYYSWTSYQFGGSYPSALEACIAVSNYNLGGNIKHGTATVSDYSLGGKRCHFVRDDGTTWTSNTTYRVTRLGDSCPPDTTYNSETGGCEAPNACSETENVTLFHMFRSGITRSNAYDPWPSGAEIETPVTVCASGCRYSGANYTGDIPCAAARDGDPLVQYCIAGFLGMGVECQAGDAPYQSSTSQPSESPGESGEGDPAPEPIEPDPASPEYACRLVPGFQWTGTQCVSALEEPAPSPNPDSPEPGSPGGGGSGSGSDGGSGDDGGTGGTGEDPSGPGDPSTGSGGSQSENPNNVLGTECDQTLQCTGDAYECALLYHTKKSRCDLEESLDFEAQRPQIEALLQGDEYTLDQDEIDIPSFIGEGARFLPGTCPPPISIPLSGHTYSFNTAPFCTFASELGNLIVAFAALAAALYVGRAFGGE